MTFQLMSLSSQHVSIMDNFISYLTSPSGRLFTQYHISLCLAVANCVYFTKWQVQKSQICEELKWFETKAVLLLAIVRYIFISAVP